MLERHGFNPDSSMQSRHGTFESAHEESKTPFLVSLIRVVAEHPVESIVTSLVVLGLMFGRGVLEERREDDSRN